MCTCVVLVNEDSPIYIVEAAESTGYSWINDLPHPRYSANINLTLDWQGRYLSDARYVDTLRREAKPWAYCTRSNNCIDDSYRNAKYESNISFLYLFFTSVNLLGWLKHFS